MKGAPQSEDLSQIRRLSAGSSQSSQQSRRLDSVLGGAGTVERLTVGWPGGQSDEFADLEGRRLAWIREGGEFEVKPLPGAAAAGDG